MSEVESTSEGWTLLQDGKEFGPYTAAEIQKYIANGSIQESSTLWREGMDGFAPIADLFPQSPPAPYEAIAAFVPPAQTIGYTSRTTQRRPRGIAGYRQNVGRRSFLFQLWLLAWTVSYGAWLLSIAASENSHAGGGAGTAVPPFASSGSSAFSPADMMTGITSGWICLFAGWGVVGLPVGIAAIATMEPKRS